jgi:CRP-like cAMP-binding protein
MISLDFLENIEVFANLNDKQLAAIQGCCEAADYKRGEKIFAAGETSEYFWIVGEGQINLTWEMPKGPAIPESTITTLTPGMPFGWSSMVAPYKYRLSARCDSRNCKVIRIQRERLNRLFAADAQLGYKIMSKVMVVARQRFHQLREEVAKRRGQDIIYQW